MTRIVTRTYRLYPDKTMKIVLDQLCDYRRCCWNQALELWNDLYDDRRILPFYAYRFVPNKNGIKEEKINLKTMPNWRLVRNMMVEQKQDWQYQYSAHLLQLAVQDLGKAWQAFFDKSQARQGKPGFKSKKLPKQGFKSDQAKLKDITRPFLSRLKMPSLGQSLENIQQLMSMSATSIILRASNWFCPKA